MGPFAAEEMHTMTKISMLAAALALVAIPACKKKDADQSATPPATPAMGSGSAMGSNAMAKPVDKPAEAAKPKTAQELADGYKACGDKLNSGKVDDFVKDCLADDFTSKMMDHEMKKADMKGMFEGMRAAFPDMKWQPQLVLVNGHNIFAVALSTGTHEGTMKMPGMPDVPATHKKFGQLVAHKLTLGDDGKAKQEQGWEDEGTFASQLGLMPGKDAPPKRAAMDKGLDGAPIVAIAADDAKEKANVELVKKSDDAFNAHKPADVMALLTDDAVETDVAAPKDAVGKKEIEKGLKDFQNAFSDGKVTADVWGAGDYVVSIGKFEGTNDHDMGKMKKTGKHVSVDMAEVSQIKDGKISHLWRFYNGMDFAKQLGLLPPPGAGDAAKAGDAKAGDAKKDDKKAPAPKK